MQSHHFLECFTFSGHQIRPQPDSPAATEQRRAHAHFSVTGCCHAVAATCRHQQLGLVSCGTPRTTQFAALVSNIHALYCSKQMEQQRCPIMPHHAPNPCASHGVRRVRCGTLVGSGLDLLVRIEGHIFDDDVGTANLKRLLPRTLEAVHVCVK